MKKAIFTVAATALLLASCDTSTKDSYSNIPYLGFNMIVDTYDLEQPAIVSTGLYKAHTILSKGVVDISSSEIIINNQKYSFETDTMALRYSTFKTQDGQSFVSESFSQKGPAGVGSAASDLEGYYSWHYVRYSGNEYAPEVEITNPNYQIGLRQGLNMSYKLSDRYKIQTFNCLYQALSSNMLFRGNSYANDESGSFSTKKTDYLIGFDFQNKVASVLIYNPEYSTTQAQDFPKIIMLEKVAINIKHDSFSFEGSAPTTKVLSVKETKSEFVDNPAIKVTDFSMTMLSDDLTEVEIKYNINGKAVSFTGCSIMKANR